MVLHRSLGAFGGMHVKLANGTDSTQLARQCAHWDGLHWDNRIDLRKRAKVPRSTWTRSCHLAHVGPDYYRQGRLAFTKRSFGPSLWSAQLDCCRGSPVASYTMRKFAANTRPFLPPNSTIQWRVDCDGGSNQRENDYKEKTRNHVRTTRVYCRS